MLRLNHANLPVKQPGPLRDYLVRHFGFRVLVTRGDDAFVVMEGEDGFILNIMRTKPTDGDFPDNFHIGFLLGSREEVQAKHDELIAAAAEPGPLEEITRGGFASFTFYCHAPNALLIEVGCSTT